MTERRRVCGLCDATVGPGWNFCEKHRREPASAAPDAQRTVLDWYCKRGNAYLYGDEMIISPADATPEQLATCERRNEPKVQIEKTLKQMDEYLLRADLGLLPADDEPPAYQQAIDRKLEALAKNNLDLYGVQLTVPYRTATITGICKLDHEHNGKDCKYERAEPTDQPRKGFEFL